MKTILVIEDEAIIRNNIATILSHQGFQVVGAENGEAGIQMAKAYLPDLIVCDVMMPDCDGYEVLQRMRNETLTSTIPFIFLSAKVNKPDIRQGMNLGADDYLTKPFTQAELLDAISARLNRQSSQVSPYVHEMKRAAENLNHLAFYDPLTNLPNLILLHQRLRELLVQLQPRPNALVAVLRLWVESSKENQSGGFDRPLGDALIQAVGKRLIEFKEADDLNADTMVARLSSNEFGLVASHLQSKSDLEPFIHHLLTFLASPYHLAHRTEVPTFHIGVSLYPEHGTAPSGLLSQAEMAARTCRLTSNQQYCIYAPTMEEEEARRREFLINLEAALDHQEFQLYYQPQINLVSERIIGVEALLRWQHPYYGQIMPDTFIPLAEEAGILPALGAWVLQTACNQVKQWQSLTLVPLKISVNLWPQQLWQNNFLASMMQAVHTSGIEPSQLVLDMSESCLMAMPFTAIAQLLDDISATGVQLAVDGFGMRCLPLQHLKRLPVHYLKLDKSFIDHIVDDERDAILTETIIGMAYSLKLSVIAKGIETEEQLTALKKHGCHAMQGYLYSPPLPPDDLKHLLTNGTPKSLQPQG